MSLDKSMQNLKFDKRLAEWAVATGLISKEDLQKHLDALPDLGSKVEIVNLGDDRSRSETH